MTPEQLLYTRIADALKPSWDVQRIENTIGRGIPDITASSVEFGELWIEAKAGKNPLKPLIRPEQYAWMRRRAYFGGRCCVITWHDSIWNIFPVYSHTKLKSAGSSMLRPESGFSGDSLVTLITDTYGTHRP